MSSILNALKKLEQERKRETRRTSNLPLDAAILQEGHPLERRGPSNGILVAGALMLFLTGAGIVYLINRPAAQQPAHEPKASATITVAPVVTKNGQPQDNQPLSPRTKISEPPSPAVKPEKQPTPLPRAHKPVANPHQPAVLPAPQRLPAVPPAVHRPSLKVLGIAYQAGDTSSSVAIVNGTPVSVGSTVDGARVEEIQKDRVRFSQAGEKFEVLLAR